MIVENRTNVDIVIKGDVLKPNQKKEYYESLFNVLNINSEIGGCTIIRDYWERSIKNRGKFLAEESDDIDSFGMKVIVIRSI